MKNNERFNIRWSITKSPTNRHALFVESYFGQEHNYLSDIYRKKIIFRHQVNMSVQRYENINNLHARQCHRGTFVSQTNTPVGTTFEYFLLQVYKHMYNLDDNQMMEDLPLEKEELIRPTMYYSFDKNIYVFDV